VAICSPSQRDSSVSPRRAELLRAELLRAELLGRGYGHHGEDEIELVAVLHDEEPVLDMKVKAAIDIDQPIHVK
jgi:hypothetical protein